MKPRQPAMLQGAKSGGQRKMRKAKFSKSTPPGVLFLVFPRKEQKGRKTMANRIFTSESVTEGHPDKVCDQISDAVLDAILAKDPTGRVACETVTTTGMVMVMGEISTKCYVDIPHVVRRTVDKIGYNDPVCGFDARSCAVMTAIDEQSGDIAMGVDGDSDETIGTRA